MDIVVPVKMVPDLVEELEVNAEGTDLDRSVMKLRINEFDEHAVEEALGLKGRHGARVTVLAVDTGDVDETLFTCLAKGADRAVKITGDFQNGVSSHTMAAVLAKVIAGMPHDLILAGVQAADDRDGQVGVLLGATMGLPHVSVVTGVEPAGDKAVSVRQEYAGGLVAELEVDLPAVLGIQAARQAPRYAPVSKVRQIMKTAKLEAIAAPAVDAGAGSTVRRLAKPEVAGRAEFIEGSPEEVAERLYAILTERGLVK
ncbi:MAG: electron transfer flavoprotein subunit beta/FixA family protein [Candidatus Rokubacteria bacterium]|nr:electron transfer flavoprotein subunit beta/FixA family protein [Candidatus Rokubacteria bacterium]